VLDAADAGLPTQGLRLWLRADLGVATLGAAGVSVCRWEDLSGNARHFTPAFAATPPTLAAAGLRGRPSVTFPTDSQALVRYDLLGIAPTAGRTVALIGINRDLTRRYQAFLQGQPNTPGTYLGLDTNTFQTAGAREGAYVTNNGYDVDLATSTSARTHLFSVSTMVPGTALPGALTYTVDGVERTLTRTPGGLGNGLIEDFSGATYTALGAGAAGFLGAELGDVLVWDRALTASERAQVEAYFSARYP
jgi:hypothetical protein